MNKTLRKCSIVLAAVVGIATYLIAEAVPMVKGSSPFGFSVYSVQVDTTHPFPHYRCDDKASECNIFIHYDPSVASCVSISGTNRADDATVTVGFKGTGGKPIYFNIEDGSPLSFAGTAADVEPSSVSSNNVNEADGNTIWSTKMVSNTKWQMTSTEQVTKMTPYTIHLRTSKTDATNCPDARIDFDPIILNRD